MPPKIEVLPDAEPIKKSPVKPRKNPFEVRPKKTTVKREALEVYPQRKGLNKPENLGNKPVDLKFQYLARVLDGRIDETSVDLLYERIFATSSEQSSQEWKDQQLEKVADFSNEVQKRYLVVSSLLDDLIEVQTFSEENDLKDPNLIKISLHDIQTFSKLIISILIHGIYPVLSTFSIGIPIEKRQLKDFNTSKLKIEKLKPESAKSANQYLSHQVLLELIYEKFSILLNKESDVKQLMIKGTGFSDFLVITIALITVPQFQVNRQKLLEEFQSVISIPETYELFQTYTLLISTRSPPYFRAFVMEKLTSLHYDAPKNDGVETLIEFVLGLRKNDDVTLEKLDQVANIVLRKPKHIGTVEYFENISKQCYDLLVNINKPTITSCVGHLIEKLWFKNDRIVKDFFFSKVWNIFDPPSGSGVLVTEAELNNSINVLISLSKKGLEPEITTVLFNRILVALWSYLVFLRQHQKLYEAITGILISYFTLIKDNEDAYGLRVLVQNLLSEGGEYWQFEIGSNGLVQIVSKPKSLSSTAKMNQFIRNLDNFSGYFLDFLSEVDDELIQQLFLQLLDKWLFPKEQLGQDINNDFFMLIDLRLLEGIGSKFKDVLAKTPQDILRIVRDFLNPELVKPSTVEQSNDEVDSDDEDDFDSGIFHQTLPVVLELLSAILSETPSFDKESRELVIEIQKSLGKIASLDLQKSLQTSSRALHDRIETLVNGTPATTNQLDKDGEILKRAITSLNDPLVPIRAHGLHLLRQLVELRSEAISLDFVIELHLVQLKDSEPYIYLNVIKGLRSLMDLHPKETIRILVSSYVNENKDMGLDERLKIGEAFLGYIQTNFQMFTGDTAKLIVDATLSTIRLSNDKEKEDNRLRMSSMSLLGVCCTSNPLGMLEYLEDILDCAFGILELETDKESAIMRRSAVVLIHDIILGTSESDTVPFPSRYRDKVITILTYTKDNDNDLLVREQCTKVLDTIAELAQLGMEVASERYRTG
ncbi:uncharacterized protein CANTADRAFT_8303 [Suhomyces tanzawaensis NRRL Y-17324]|uniref:RNA polymerase II assembly factor Rtp1 C-terminal domain-containing protein n=1 Tax=Suhomyces tanzawaensis NRRL Y-17324 TaxID=984487 RepID=A0A1E4SCD6_9ASCO|nr:uncharacterized protein CANTADRAFT_8303 [Suhomyces tanzawaensis NRRL Y-17324]ODV77155.1 hypothetical protein CANTADRAFT_8303 [Suhomyces tanzawaensis NRRL Y-17324]